MYALRIKNIAHVPFLVMITYRGGFRSRPCNCPTRLFEPLPPPAPLSPLERRERDGSPLPPSSFATFDTPPHPPAWGELIAGISDHDLAHGLSLRRTAVYFAKVNSRRNRAFARIAYRLALNSIERSRRAVPGQDVFSGFRKRPE